ncbi:MAG: HAD family hydrolase, partial [Dehalococcoidia bacterium]
MSGTIKAVFFDMYNTLARFDPPREELQQRVCKEFGIEVSKRGILQGYVAADDYMAQEHGRNPLTKRSREEQRQFFSEYQRLVLQGADTDVSRELAGEIFGAIRKIPYDLALFDDAIPCLEEVKERGVKVGMITHIYRDIGEVCDRLGLS